MSKNYTPNAKAYLDRRFPRHLDGTLGKQYLVIANSRNAVFLAMFGSISLSVDTFEDAKRYAQALLDDGYWSPITIMDLENDKETLFPIKS